MDATELCECGHPLAAHEHYRRGSDCGVCGKARCNEFTAARTSDGGEPASRTVESASGAEAG